VKACEYDRYSGSKIAYHASDDSDFEETPPTDKGKKCFKLRDATTVELSQTGTKRDGDSSSVMMKLGALEYRVRRLEESFSGRQKELSDQKEKAICLENENKHLASKVATHERAVSTKQENLNALKSKYDDIKHSFKCLIC